MSAKNKNLQSFDNKIEELQKQIEQQKLERKKYEKDICEKIGKEYVKLMRLDDKNLNVDEVLDFIILEVKEKKNRQKDNQQ